MNKSEARQFAKNLRNEMSSVIATKYSDTIQNIFLNSEYYKHADTIFLYKSVNNEVDTDAIMKKAKADGKRVAYPRVIDRDIKFYLIDSFEELVFGYMGIPEPEINPYKLVEDDEAVLILPGVAFDAKLNRVGYGGGFYDRFIGAHPNMTKIAFAYDSQIMNDIEFDEYDRKADMIITEKKIYTLED